MKDSVALRYASALLSLALEDETLDLYQKAMKMIRKIIIMNPDFMMFMKHYNIESKDKKKMIDVLFSEELPNVVNFLKLLVDKNRIGHLLTICDTFNTLCNESKGIKEGIIYSTIPLKKEAKEIELWVSKKMNCQVVLKNEIDRSLIGGIKVVVDDTIFDNTIYRKLQVMQKELINGKEGEDNVN